MSLAILFLFVFVLLFFPLLYMFLGLNINIHLLYTNYVNLYNIFIIFLIFFSWFIVAFYLYNYNTRKEIIDIIKYLVDRNTDIGLANVLKETYNSMSDWLWFSLIFTILIPFFFLINDIMISSLLLSFYFANILTIFLIYQFTLDFVKRNIEKKNLKTNS